MRGEGRRTGRCRSPQSATAHPALRTLPPTQAKVFELVHDDGSKTGKVLKINHGGELGGAERERLVAGGSCI